MTKSLDTITPGDVHTRTEIRAVFGGGPQGGICPTKGIGGNVSLYSDPSVGEKVGYYDGWLAEEDEVGPIFEYTGAGKVGNQSFEGNGGAVGNRAILSHAELGRTLRVFTQVGRVPGTDTRTHRYLGAFTLDALQPYVWRRVHGEDGKIRDVIVFRLRPDGEFQRTERDAIPPAEKTGSELVSFEEVTTAMLHSDPATSGTLGNPGKKSPSKTNRRPRKVPNKETSGLFVVPEVPSIRMSLRAATAATVAVRHGVSLTHAYKNYLESVGHETGVFQIKVEGLTSTLRSGLYDATDHVLYEARGSSSREDVRMAFSKVLDYNRYIEVEGRKAEPRPVVLLPAAPDPDMRSLLGRYGVGLVYRAENGLFVGDTVPPLS
ncbi:hypothetical protein ACFWSJ_27020 [Streptomyces niveus]|uniref:hypothetical protein n=1 Tax=Streptomyces niveus TaxID=193462 RepID=UPI0036569D58